MQDEREAVRRYRILLRAFPAAFRARYGDDVVRTFRDHWRARARGAPVPRRVAFWVRVGLDALLQGGAERVGGLIDRGRTPRPRRPTEHARRPSIMHRIENLVTEFGLARRTIRRRPAFSVSAVLILGLPLAAAVTLWGAVYHVSLAPLGFEDEERLVQIWHKANRGELDERFGMSDALLLALREHSRTLEEVAWIDIVAPQNGGVFEPVDGPPEIVPYTRVSTNFFTLLGVRPHLGRAFTPGEEGDPVAMLSHEAWHRSFGADPDVVGRSARLRGQVVEIVGVLPAAFVWPDLGAAQADFWLPTRLDPSRLEIFYYDAVGRVRAGASLDDAELDAHRVLQPVSRASFDAEHWGAGPDRWVTVATLREGQLGEIDARARTLVVAVAALMALGVVNLALLLLIRAVRRGRETSVRVALGATGSGVYAPTLAEVTLLTVLAAGLALGLAAGALALMRGFAPWDVARLDQVAISGPVLIVGAGLALLAGIVASLAPVAVVRSAGVRAVLQTMSEGAGGGQIPRRLRIPLLITAGAMAVILLFGANLTTRSMLALETVDLGFEADAVLQGRLRLPVDRFWTPVTDAPGHYRIASEITVFRRELRRRLESHPAVTAATLAQHTPLGPRYGAFTPFVREGDESGDMPPGEAWISHNAGDPDFLEFMGVELLAGRWLSRNDDENAPPVALVSDPLARRFWPGESPIGHRFRGFELVLDSTGEFREEEKWITVVGVVTPMREWDVRATSESVYTTLAQELPVGRYVRGRAAPLSLFVRHRGDVSEVASHMRTTVAELLPGTPVDGIEPMAALSGRMLAEPRFLSAVFSGFAVLALLLAGAGVAAVVGFGVSSRGRELGVRVALGAWARDVVPLFAGETLACTGAGLVLGIGVSVAASRVFGAMVYGVPPLDPYSLAGAALVFALIVTAAAVLPVRRALADDPARLLRHD